MDDNKPERWSGKLSENDEDEDNNARALNN